MGEIDGIYSAQYLTMFDTSLPTIVSDFSSHHQPAQQVVSDSNLSVPSTRCYQVLHLDIGLQELKQYS